MVEQDISVMTTHIFLQDCNESQIFCTTVRKMCFYFMHSGNEK